MRVIWSDQPGGNTASSLDSPFILLNHSCSGETCPAESGAELLTFAVGRTPLSLQARCETAGQDGHSTAQ